MTGTAGFKISRSALLRRGGPITALPEQGDSERLDRFSNTLKEFGENRAAYVGEIEKLWGEAQERFLTIGRYLVRAKKALPHGAFEAMVADELPFGKHVAWQLRTVATAVDGGRIDEEELPQSYNTAYKLAKLDDRVLELARQQNLVRTNVTREEVARFLRQLASSAPTANQPSDHLIEERDALKRRLKALLSEQRETKRRIAEIEREMGSVTTSTVIAAEPLVDSARLAP